MVSLRSYGIVDVRKIAENFGGGGDVRAAGCTVDGNVRDIVNNITPFIEQQLKQEKSV